MPFPNLVVSPHAIVRQPYPLPTFILEAVNLNVVSLLAVVRLLVGAEA